MSPCNFGILLIFHYFLKSRALSRSLRGEWKLQGRHCHLGEACAAVVNDGTL